MFLDTIYVISRETLEVSYVAGLLAALVCFGSGPMRFLPYSVLVGAAGATVFAAGILNAFPVFTGSAYEWFVTSLFALMAIFITAVCACYRYEARASTCFVVMAGAVVSLSVVKELGEILLYWGPAWNRGASTLMLGSLVGLGIGSSVGALVYLVLRRFQGRTASYVVIALLALVTGGLWMECVTLLMQAGIVTPQPALWTVDSAVQEDSFLGQLLNTVANYEASPSMAQLLVYLSGAGAVVVVSLGRGWWCRPKGAKAPLSGDE